MQYRSVTYLVAVLLTAAIASVSAAQLRIVTYNTTPTLNTGLRRVLSEIGNQSVNGIVRPIDILALQEKGSQAVETQQILDIFDDLYGEDVYERGNVNGAGFFTQGVIYRTDTVELVSEVRIGSTSPQGAARQTLRYQLRPIGYQNADFYIYNSHFKANNNAVDAARRGVEAEAIRRNADSLGDVPIIFLGDLNLYGDQSPAYQALTADGPARAIDPINMDGPWHNNPDFKLVHTQSTTVTGGDNRASGGVDDRFDFQLVTDAFMDGEGLSYIGPETPNLVSAVNEHSYRVFGNNGTHSMNQNIGSGTGASRVVLRSLEVASDHLPVVVDYQLPAIPEIWSTYPEKVIVGAQAMGNVHIRNGANVDSAVGADELDFSVTGPEGNLTSGIALPNQEAEQIEFTLNTATSGRQQFDVSFHTTSPMVDRSTITELIEYSVVRHANGSLASDGDVNSLAIDLGVYAIGDEIAFEFPIYNMASDFGEAAALLIDNVEASQAISEITFPETAIKSGESQLLSGRLDASQPGMQSADMTIFLHDEPIPGAQPNPSLHIRLSATLTTSLLPGDFNRDGQLDAEDINALTIAAISNTHELLFDLNEDRLVNDDDRIVWVDELRKTHFGDSNLDGEFNSADFVAVFQASEYEDELPSNSNWTTGDWNGDLEFSSSDFVLAFQAGGYEKGPRVALAPEPNAHLLALLCSLFVVRKRTSPKGRR